MHVGIENNDVSNTWGVGDVVEAIKFIIEEKNIPISSITKEICNTLHIDPLGILSSGCLLIFCESSSAKTLQQSLETNNIPTSIIGKVMEGNGVHLIENEIEKPMPIPPPPIPVPQLAGIVRINSRTSALLRISPPSGGPAEYKFIGVGEMLNGVEVMRIDLKRDIVEVKIRNRTYSLELDKNTVANSGSTARPTSGSRSSSSPLSVIPSRGSSSSSRGTTSDREKKLAEWRKKQEEARKADGSETSPSRPSGSSGGLKGVPQRRRSP